MTRIYGTSRFFVCDRGEVVISRAELREAGITVRLNRGWPTFRPKKNAGILEDLLRNLTRTDN